MMALIGITILIMFAKVYEDTWYNEKDISSDQSLCSFTLYYSVLFAHIRYCNIFRAATHNKVLMIQEWILEICRANRYEPSASLYRKIFINVRWQIKCVSNPFLHVQVQEKDKPP